MPFSDGVLERSLTTDGDGMWRASREARKPVREGNGLNPFMMGGT